MAGSSRSTPFPVPVYIYRSFIDPRFTGTSTGTGTGTQGFEVSLSWSWSDLINHLQQSALTSPGLDFLPTLHYPSIYWWHYVMVSIIQPWTWDRGLLWLTLSFFIYITAKPVGYIYPKEISINTVKFLYQTIAHLDSSIHPSIHPWSDLSASRVFMHDAAARNACVITRKSPNVQSFGIKIWTYWSRSPLGICNRPVWRLYI